MPFTPGWFGTTTADIDTGALDLVATTLEVSLHDATIVPVTGMTTRAALDASEISGTGYERKTLASKTFARLEGRRFRVTAANTTWAALTPSARYAVVATAAGRLVGWIDPGVLLVSSGGPATIDWTIEDVLAGTANPNAGAVARRLHRYLKERPEAGSTLRWVSGQHLGNIGAASTGLSEWAQIEAQTGERPGVMGIDVDAGANPGNYATALNAATAHASAGGIVTVSCHMRIPALGVTSEVWDDLSPTVQGHLDFENLTDPGHADYQAFHDRIDQYVPFLSALKANEVPTIERFLHEVTARRNFWSVDNPSCTEELFKLLHAQIRDHLWNDAGLDNLLACYSPQDADSLGTASNGRRARFCDPANTDIVAPTAYNMVPSSKVSMFQDTFSRLPELIHGVGEFGRPASGAAGAGPMDMRLWVAAMKALPTAVYGMTWTGYRGWQSNLSSNEALDDPYVVNLDEVDL